MPRKRPIALHTSAPICKGCFRAAAAPFKLRAHGPSGSRRRAQRRPPVVQRSGHEAACEITIVDIEREIFRGLWSRALCFRIGVAGVEGLDQLPNAKDFPDRFPDEEFGSCFFLGEVLGFASLKLFRPFASHPDTTFELDEMFYDLLEELAKSESTTARGWLQVLTSVVEAALNAPHRLPQLVTWLDALTNNDLHSMAMDAVQCRRASDLDFQLEGLAA